MGFCMKRESGRQKFQLCHKDGHANLSTGRSAIKEAIKG